MMIGGADSVFLDTNILVYANTVGSPFRVPAQDALKRYDDAGTVFWISRQIMREYLATLTRQQGLITPVSVASVIADVQRFEAEFQIAEDGPDVTRYLLTLLTQFPGGGKQVHDTNIVATMQAYGITQILTHNLKDFSRFSPLITVITL